jgi:hypothetical protein
MTPPDDLVEKVAHVCGLHGFPHAQWADGARCPACDKERIEALEAENERLKSDVLDKDVVQHAWQSAEAEVTRLTAQVERMSKVVEAARKVDMFAYTGGLHFVGPIPDNDPLTALHKALASLDKPEDA